MKLNTKSLLASLLFAGSMNAEALIIDNFDSGFTHLYADGQSITTGLNETSTIGGTRKISISTESGWSSANAMVVPDFFAHNSNVGTKATSTLTWDANGSGLGVDLTEGGDILDTFLVLDIDFDQGDVSLGLALEDGAGNQGSVLFGNIGIGPQTFGFEGFSGIDFTNINSISLTINGDTDTDLAIYSIETLSNATGAGPSPIPEPTGLALLGLGLIGLGFRHRRNQPI